jgi:hypothetical protein
LECWNIGTLEYWVPGKWMVELSLFHYSIIPLFHIRVKNISLQYTFNFNKL